jgi:hypothetical protein
VARKATDKLIKRVQIKIDGKDWPIVITHNTLIECEDFTGLNLLTGDANIARPSARTIRALLYLCLKHAGAEYTLEEVGLLITPDNLVKVQQGLISAWEASMPDPKAESENPTEAAP